MVEANVRPTNSARGSRVSRTAHILCFDLPRRGHRLAGIGITLHDARVRHGLTIEQAAADTRISARFLDALESERFHELPAPVYVRGFLRSYANYLRVDPQPLLDQLHLGDQHVSGPDGFVGGPRSARTAPQRSSSSTSEREARRPLGGRGVVPDRGNTDPFRRTGAKEMTPAEGTDEFGDDQEEYDEREAVGARRAGPPPVMNAGRRASAAPIEPEFDDNEAYEDEYVPDEPVYRPRRTAGLLLERPGAQGDGAPPARVLTIVGGAMLLLIAVLAGAVFLTRGGGGDDSNAASANPTATPTTKPSTVIAVGSPGNSPSPNASASPSGSPSPTASVSPSPAGTPGTTTATPTQGAATPTPTSDSPTATPTTAAPTPTPIPPTPTPIPPTPTPTAIPIPSHPDGAAECTANHGTCSDAGALIRVVCAPNGWFVDVPSINGVFPAESYNWPVRNVASYSQAEKACG